MTAVDHLLPRFHIRPPTGFLNDPNGPVLIDGVQHLYFQYRHTTDTAAPVVWGHASSTDLVHWRLHRPAMAPDPTGLDRDGCWSGNAVRGDDGVLRAFYSGFRRDHPVQSALVATSADGAAFGPPSLAADDPDDVVHYRDPFVWREADGTWRMVLGAGDADGAASLRLFASDDLARFTPAGVLARLPRTRVDGVDTGAMWECPQVLDVDGTRVVLVGGWAEDAGTLRVHAVLPDGGADRLDGLGLHLVDEGPEFYAASGMRESPHGPVVWGWVTEGRAEAAWQEAGWAGAISLPRVVRLGEGGRLLSARHPALEGLRGQEADGEIGAQAELAISAPASGGVVELAFGPGEVLRLELTGDGRVIVDRDRASTDPRAHPGRFAVEGAGVDGFDLRVFVDGSVFELFTATGRVATFRCYPHAAPPWRFSASAGIRVRAWEAAAQ